MGRTGGEPGGNRGRTGGAQKNRGRTGSIWEENRGRTGGFWYSFTKSTGGEAEALGQEPGENRGEGIFFETRNPTRDQNQRTGPPVKISRYEHQVGDDGQPIPVAPEIIKKFEDAVKRYGETRAQAKPKAAPRGGVSSSMLLLEPDYGIELNAAEARDSDDYYAMVDSGTNAIILPLHPRMVGDIAECQVPSATVTGPIVQVYEFNDSKRLVVALPQSTILVSQEWLTTIAQWEFTSGPSSELGSECRVNRLVPQKHMS